MHEAGVLSVVGTPIGNLGDITLRALETLRNADIIATEDTRVTAKLLARYNIKKPLIPYHAHNARIAGTRVLALLADGKRVALVTDAGTPGISDPGTELVALVRERLREDVRIEVMPGPSALTAALSIAGLPTTSFVFLGFLPHKKGRQTLLKEIAAEKRAVVLYESPHRAGRLLASLAELLPSSRQLAVCRELTKLHEQGVTGSARELSEACAAGQIPARGEFVIVIGPC